MLSQKCGSTSFSVRRTAERWLSSRSSATLRSVSFLAVLEKKYVVLTLAVYLSVQKENDLLGDQKEWKSLKREVTKSGSGAGKKPEEWVGSRGEVAN